MTEQELHDVLRTENLGRMLRCVETQKLYKIVADEYHVEISLISVALGSALRLSSIKGLNFEWYTPELTLGEILKIENVGKRYKVAVDHIMPMPYDVSLYGPGMPVLSYNGEDCVCTSFLINSKFVEVN